MAYFRSVTVNVQSFLDSMIQPLRRFKLEFSILVCMALCGLGPDLFAQDTRHSIQNFREQSAEWGFTFEASATTDILALMDGGLDEGIDTPTTFDVLLSLDTEKANWWGNGRFFLYLLGTAGSDPSVRTGDTQGTSSLEAENTYKIFEAYYEHTLFDERLSLLFGLHDLNSEFYVLDHAGLFLNGSFGNGVEISQVDASLFPVSALAARIRLRGDQWYWLTAVYDGVPGDPGDAFGTQISLQSDDGLFTISEFGIEFDSYAKLAIGGWHHGRRYDDFSGKSQNSNSGLYLIGEGDVYRYDNGRHVGVFAQLGFAENDRNQIGTYVGGGVTWVGMLKSRPEDVVGIGVAHARNSRDFRRVNRTMDKAETTVELSYRAQILPRVSVRPDIQYVVNPGTSREIQNAVVFGLRIHIDL